MYGHSRVVGGVLFIAFIVEQAVMAVSLAITTLRVTFTAKCISLTVSPIIVWFAYVPIFSLHPILHVQLTAVSFVPHV